MSNEVSVHAQEYGFGGSFFEDEFFDTDDEEEEDFKPLMKPEWDSTVMEEKLKQKQLLPLKRWRHRAVPGGRAPLFECFLWGDGKAWIFIFSQESQCMICLTTTKHWLCGHRVMSPKKCRVKEHALAPGVVFFFREQSLLLQIQWNTLGGSSNRKVNCVLMFVLFLAVACHWHFSFYKLCVTHRTENIHPCSTLCESSPLWTAAWLSVRFYFCFLLGGKESVFSVFLFELTRISGSVWKIFWIKKYELCLHLNHCVHNQS